MSLTLELRHPAPRVAVVEVQGDLTGQAEAELATAYDRAVDAGARAVVLDFRQLGFLNSGGIGLLVTLLVRANRHQRRLLAFGLSDHYRQIFELTRLDEAITIYTDETAALAGADR